MKQTLFLFILSLGSLLAIWGCKTDPSETSDRAVPIPNNNPDLSEYYDNSSPDALFRVVPPEESGLYFTNEFRETLDDNFWKYKLAHPGSGVGMGVGDFDNDGLPDLFFASNRRSNALYLNKGNLEFEDITAQAGIQDSTGFTYGVAVVDINQDGWLDVYLSKGGGIHEEGKLRANKLYINNKDLTFTEQAEEYGLADESNSTQAAFLDYDGDGDLDMYLVSHWMSDKQIFSLKTLAHIEKGTNFSDVFYRNNGDGTYTEVAKEIGINNNGVGWSGMVGDYDNDSDQDIYVANDFIMFNYLYMNQGNGQFEQKAFDNLRKMTRFGMGSDAGDINNDGWLDVVVTGIDMEDQEDQRGMLDFSNTKQFDGLIASGFHYQKPRNTLQLNNGDGTFSEIGAFAGVTTTGWSWGVLLEDFDNDAWSDLFVANGYGIPWYLDNRFKYYGKLRRAVKAEDEKAYFELREEMRRDYHRYNNEIFQNKQGLRFERKTKEWGIALPTMSHGAATVDLDNDGDMDLVATNGNQAVAVYENRARQLNDRNYLKITFTGQSGNIGGWGTIVRLLDDNGEVLQHKQLMPLRGSFSTSDHRMNFGLSDLETIPQLLVIWPDGRQQLLKEVAVNTTLNVKYADAVPGSPLPRTASMQLAQPVGQEIFSHTHKENVFDDFDRQFTLHYRQSKHGPGVAVADVNGDQLDDLYYSGAAGHAAALYLQNGDGRLIASPQPAFQADRRKEGMGALFLDVDGDSDQDLYQCNGGGTYSSDGTAYQDRLYLNDGLGNFEPAPNGSLPTISSSGSCVVAGDYDGDGDLDLFVGGRVVPNFYPQTPRSYLLRNDGGRFTDVTPEQLQYPGMVTSALWTDHNNDDQLDLMLVGDWMPIRIYTNQSGQLQQTDMGLSNTEGWWNSITGADFDADGDVDYLLGNAGLNHVRLSRGEFPLKVVHGDFNADEQYDLFYTYEKEGKEWPVFSFAAFQKQFPEWKEVIKGFSPYARQPFPKIRDRLFPGQGESLIVNTWTNYWIENKGDGGFELHELPTEAQLSPILGAVTGDFDGDGHLDALCHGNFYPAHFMFERQDAGTGLFLQGDGKGGFKAYRGLQSGFLSDGDARGLALLGRRDQAPLLVAANNNSSSTVFELPTAQTQFRFLPDDRHALVRWGNGKVQRIENYHGCGYLSQSSLSVFGAAARVEITGRDGKSR